MQKSTNMAHETLNNYYPVFLDIQELQRAKEAAPDQATDEGSFIDPTGELNNLKTDADKLLALANDKSLTELQTLMLLVKNAFEGQIYLQYELDNKHLLKYGTLYIDWENNIVTELTPSFIENLDIYLEGLYNHWKKIYAQKTDPKVFPDVIKVMINSQLFRLPVSRIKDLPLSLFMDKLLANPFYTSLAPPVYSIVADKVHIEIIDEMYQQSFSDLLQQIESKYNCINVLLTKINLASDRSVKNHNDLQKVYHEYLIKERNGAPRMALNLRTHQNSINNKVKSIDKKTGKVFREISKLCREIFVNVGDDEKHVALNNFFMMASKYWNTPSENITDQIVNYFTLSLLFIQVIISRSFSGLPVEIQNYHFLDRNWLKNKPIEKIEAGLKKHQGMMEIIKQYHETSFKMKNLADEEMSAFHKAYLQEKIENMDHEIDKLENRVNQIMNDK
jgi:hypothetical protein